MAWNDSTHAIDDGSVTAAKIAVQIADAGDYADGFTLQHNGASVIALTGDWEDWTSDGTTGIAAGSHDGQELTVLFALGTFGEYPDHFTIQDSGNVDLRGDFVQGYADDAGFGYLQLQWDAGNSKWMEIARVNAAPAAASGLYAYAEGYNTTASGDYSHAQGHSTVASNVRSHAEGENTTSSGPESHAEGYNTIASNNDSHAEGQSTTASGADSHAEGVGTTASGRAAHAEGLYAVADKWGQHAHAAGNFAFPGDAQVSELVARNSTPDATETNLYLDGVDDVIAIPTDTAWNVKVRVVAMSQVQGAGQVACAIWNEYEMLLVNSGGSIDAVNPINTDTAPSQTFDNSGAGTPGNWRVCDIDQDETNNALKIVVKGEAGVNIRWVAEIELVEVGFPAA